jgi:hypothetical protein
LGPGAQLTGEVGHEYEFAGLVFGVAGEQLVDKGPVRLGNSRVQQRGRATTRTVPASGSPAGPGGSRPR